MFYRVLPSRRWDFRVLLKKMAGVAREVYCESAELKKYLSLYRHPAPNRYG